MVQQVHTTKGGNMRRMKKAIAMGLATMMTISLAACGNTSGETTQETSGAATTENTGSGENLTFSWWGNQTRNDMTMKVIDMYCAEMPASVSMVSSLLSVTTGRNWQPMRQVIPCLM